MIVKISRESSPCYDPAADYIADTQKDMTEYNYFNDGEYIFVICDEIINEKHVSQLYQYINGTFLKQSFSSGDQVSMSISKEGYVILTVNGYTQILANEEKLLEVNQKAETKDVVVVPFGKEYFNQLFSALESGKQVIISNENNGLQFNLISYNKKLQFALFAYIDKRIEEVTFYLADKAQNKLTTFLRRWVNDMYAPSSDAYPTSEAVADYVEWKLDDVYTTLEESYQPKFKLFDKDEFGGLEFTPDQTLAMSSGPKISPNYIGMIYNSLAYSDGLACRGDGQINVEEFSNNIIKINFSCKIIGTTTVEGYKYGFNASEISRMIGYNISPIEGGNVSYIKVDGTINMGLTEAGGTFVIEMDKNGTEFWTPAAAQSKNNSVSIHHLSANLITKDMVLQGHFQAKKV